MIWLWILGRFVILPFFILLPPPAPFTVFKQAGLGGGLEGGEGEGWFPTYLQEWTGEEDKAMSSVCCAVRFSPGNPDFSTGDKMLLPAYCSLIPAFHHVQSIWERPQVQILNNVFYLPVISLNKLLTPDLIYLYYLFQIGTSIVFNGNFDYEEKGLIWKGRQICVIVLWSLLSHSLSNAAQRFLSKVFEGLEKNVLVNRITFIL